MCICFNLLFLVLFCDIFVVMVEPLAESKPNIGESPIDWSPDSVEHNVVEPDVYDVDSAKCFFNDHLYMKWKK